MRAVLACTALLAATLAGARTAEAHGCHDEACGAGYGDYEPSTVRYEVGVVTATTPVARGDNGDEATADLANDGAIASTTVAIRGLFGRGWWYVGPEASFGRVTSAPAIVPLGARGASPLTVDGTAGTVGAVAGATLATRHVVFGAELGAGVRAFELGEHGGIEALPIRAMLEARVRTQVFVTPYVSLVAHAGVGLVRRDEYVGGLAIAISLFPWDGTR